MSWVRAPHWPDMGWIVYMSHCYDGVEQHTMTPACKWGHRLQAKQFRVWCIYMQQSIKEGGFVAAIRCVMYSAFLSLTLTAVVKGLVYGATLRQQFIKNSIKLRHMKLRRFGNNSQLESRKLRRFPQNFLTRSRKLRRNLSKMIIFFPSNYHTKGFNVEILPRIASLVCQWKWCRDELNWLI